LLILLIGFEITWPVQTPDIPKFQISSPFSGSVGSKEPKSEVLCNIS
jgi:hypothetical protein